jgi:hypothetical protein
MSLDIERFLDHVDQWKCKLHKRLKKMSAAQRRAFWKSCRDEARARGWNVVKPEESVISPAKRVR